MSVGHKEKILSPHEESYQFLILFRISNLSFEFQYYETFPNL